MFRSFDPSLHGPVIYFFPFTLSWLRFNGLFHCLLRLDGLVDGLDWSLLLDGRDRSLRLDGLLVSCAACPSLSKGSFVHSHIRAHEGDKSYTQRTFPCPKVPDESVGRWFRARNRRE